MSLRQAKAYLDQYGWSSDAPGRFESGYAHCAFQALRRTFANNGEAASGSFCGELVAEARVLVRVGCELYAIDHAERDRMVTDTVLLGESVGCINDRYCNSREELDTWFAKAIAEVGEL